MSNRTPRVVITVRTPAERTALTVARDLADLWSQSLGRPTATIMAKAMLDFTQNAGDPGPEIATMAATLEALIPKEPS